MLYLNVCWHNKNCKNLPRPTKRPIDPSKNPLVMPLDQATYRLYSTLLKDIFLNEKHAIFLKIFNFDTLFTHKCFRHDCRLLSEWWRNFGGGGEERVYNLGLQPFKKWLQHSCFPAKFAKFLSTPFFTEHLRRLLLNSFKRSMWAH